MSWAYRYLRRQISLPRCCKYIHISAHTPFHLRHVSLKDEQMWQWRTRFDRWNKRPWKSWALYWRLHQSEAAAMNKVRRRHG